MPMAEPRNSSLESFTSYIPANQSPAESTFRALALGIDARRTRAAADRVHRGLERTGAADHLGDLGGRAGRDPEAIRDAGVDRGEDATRAKAPPVDHVDDAAERRKRGIGRPSKTRSFADAIRDWLEKEPDLPTQELLRRALDAARRIASMARGSGAARSSTYGSCRTASRVPSRPVRPDRSVSVQREPAGSAFVNS